MKINLFFHEYNSHKSFFTMIYTFYLKGNRMKKRD